MSKEIKTQEINEALELLVKGAVDTTINGGDLFDNIEKAGKKDLSKLVKKKITDKTGHARTVWVRAGEAIKEGGRKAKEKVKEYHRKKHEQAGYDTTEGSNFLKRSMKNVVKGIKNEVKEWKDAGKGVAKFVKGEKLTDHEKHAIKTVAIHAGIVVGMALTGDPTGSAASAGAAAVKLGSKIGLGFLEHSGLMAIGHGIVFSKGDAFNILKGEEGEEEEGEDEHSDAEAEHYMERMVLAMANYMEKQGQEGEGEQKQPKQQDGNNESKNTSEEK